MVLKVVRRFGVLGVERWRWSSWSTACCSRGDLRCRSSISLISHRSSYLVVSSLRVPGFSVLVQLPCSGSLALSASSVVFSWYDDDSVPVVCVFRLVIYSRDFTALFVKLYFPLFWCVWNLFVFRRHCSKSVHTLDTLRLQSLLTRESYLRHWVKKKTQETILKLENLKHVRRKT